FCGWRRRPCGCCWRRSARCEVARSGFRSDFLRSAGFFPAAGFVSGFVSAGAAVPVFLRPLPPRVPRRRFGFVGSLSVAAAPSRTGGGVVTGSGGAATRAAAAAGAVSVLPEVFRRRNQGKLNLLRKSARLRRSRQGSGARAAGHWRKTWAYMPLGQQGTSGPGQWGLATRPAPQERGFGSGGGRPAPDLRFAQA